MIIVDTNVILEIVKERPSVPVARWFTAQDPATIFTTSVTKAELLYEVRIMPAGRRREALDDAITRILRGFNNGLLAFDEDAARMYAVIAASRRQAGQRIDPFDLQIAAIARTQGATVATRDAGEFANCGIELINPWA